MITVRQANENDEAALLLLAQKFPAREDIEINAFQSTLKQKLSDANAYLGVAESEGILLGYASGSSHTTFYANGQTFWLDEIFVESDFRMNGTGRFLMEDVSIWCANCGCKLISLATNGAKEFYSALGYDDSARYFKKYL